jgi:hypothetical protein
VTYKNVDSDWNLDFRLDDSHNKLQTHGTVSVTVCTNNSLAVDLEFL